MVLPFCAVASEPAEDADRQTQAVRTRQLVLEFDQEMWEEAIDVFNITETVIPTRSTDIGTRIQVRLLLLCVASSGGS